MNEYHTMTLQNACIHATYKSPHYLVKVKPAKNSLPLYALRSGEHIVCNFLQKIVQCKSFSTIFQFGKKFFLPNLPVDFLHSNTFFL